jgi:hypothetical protein
VTGGHREPVATDGEAPIADRCHRAPDESRSRRCPRFNSRSSNDSIIASETAHLNAISYREVRYRAGALPILVGDDTVFGGHSLAQDNKVARSTIDGVDTAGDLVLDGNGSRSEVLTIPFRVDFDNLPDAEGIGVRGRAQIRADRLIRGVVDLKAIDENAAKSGDRSNNARPTDTGAFVKWLPGSTDAIALPRLIARTSNAWIT